MADPYYGTEGRLRRFRVLCKAMPASLSPIGARSEMSRQSFAPEKEKRVGSASNPSKRT